MTKKIKIKDLTIGGGSRIAVQSMTNTKTSDLEGTLAQLRALEAAGCDIVRFTVNDEAAAEAIPFFAENCGLPLVADIHFDHRLALMAAERGISKIRINPGNIGGEENVKKVAAACKKNSIPIRIGINGGSLEPRLLEKYGSPTAEALAESAIDNARMLEKHGFYDIVLSVKSSDVKTMIQANRLLSQMTDYPLHIGVTETGDPRRGTLKSAIGIGSLICDGIGDTLRVSLTDDPTKEVSAARDILFACGIGGGINIISCPTCGRTMTDMISLVERLEKETSAIKTEKRLDVALMGCIVNGPGEAKHADVGVACGNGCGMLFKKGEIIKKIGEDEIVPALLAEIKGLLND